MFFYFVILLKCLEALISFVRSHLVRSRRSRPPGRRTDRVSPQSLHRNNAPYATSTLGIYFKHLLLRMVTFVCVAVFILLMGPRASGSAETLRRDTPTKSKLYYKTLGVYKWTAL